MSLRAPFRQTATNSPALLESEGWSEQWDWHAALSEELQAEYFRRLLEFLARQRRAHTVLPPQPLTFEAFRQTPLARVRVVLLGQDPYHTPGMAHGLSFSVPPGQPLPPSLKNIYRERESDLGLKPPANGDLGTWAAQGVFLLNTVLTVGAGEAHSHRGQGWETFTDAVIGCISHSRPFVVFVLWGREAAKKSPAIAARHAQIVSAHPSPLSAHRGFFGSRIFSRCNRHLVERGESPIAW